APSEYLTLSLQRRSSDLGQLVCHDDANPVGPAPAVVNAGLHALQVHRAGQLLRIAGAYSIQPELVLRQQRIERRTHLLPVVDKRSEEHTSELQSRFDLVC